MESAQHCSTNNCNPSRVQNNLIQSISRTEWAHYVKTQNIIPKYSPLFRHRNESEMAVARNKEENISHKLFCTLSWMDGQVFAEKARVKSQE